VQHSQWWLRAHWGRIFEFEQIADTAELGHGLLVLRKREIDATAADLEAVEPGEPREFAALRHNVAQLEAETIALAEDREAHAEALRQVSEERDTALRTASAPAPPPPSSGLRRLLSRR
jgi:hypothetical protein